MSTWQEAKNTISTALDSGDAQQAFVTLRPFVGYPLAMSEKSNWKESFGLFRRVSEELGADALAKCIEQVLENLDDAEALYNAGYEAYEQSLHDVGAALMWRVNELTGGSEPQVIAELVGNLEELMAYGAGRDVLLASSGLLDENFMCRYLLAFSHLMLGDLEKAKPWVQKLSPGDEETEQYMASVLTSMLARADTIGGALELDDRALQGWHAAINGGILLHVSPHGLDDPMRGRYAMINDNYPLCREGIDKLGILLRSQNILPKQIIAFPDYASQVLGTAASKILELPLKTGPSTDPGLVVVYDPDRLENHELMGALQHHQPGQIFYAHALGWTNPFPWAPDIANLLYQVCVAPWEPGPNEESKDPPSVEDAAAQIVSASSEDSDATVATSIVKSCSALPPERSLGLHRQSGSRDRFRKGSPVPSAQFI